MPLSRAEAEQPVLNDLNASYAKEEIRVLMSEGIFRGYEDGTFRPDLYISRQELAVALRPALRLHPVPDAVYPFADVAGWAEDAVSVLRQHGITRGAGGAFFRGNQAITRQELAVWAVRSLGILDPGPVRSDRFRDRDTVSAYAEGSVEVAGAIGLMQGGGQGNFAPERKVTRQEAAMVAYRLYYGLNDYRGSAARLLGIDEPDPSPEPKEQKSPAPGAPNASPPEPLTTIFDRPEPPIRPTPVAVTPVPEAPSAEQPSVTPPETDPPAVDVPEPEPPVPEPPVAEPPVVTPPEPQPPATEPPTETPSVVYAKIASAALTDAAPPSRYEREADTWRLPYSLRDISGEILSGDRLASDTSVTFTDAEGIFGADGSIARADRLPEPGTTISVEAAVYSKLADSAFTQTFLLRVRPIPETAAYFGISILLDSDGSGRNGTAPEEMNRLRAQLQSLTPGRPIRVTWALSSNFVFWENNRPALAEVRKFVHDHGDEVGIAIGYPNDNFDFGLWRRTIGEWLYMYRYNTFGEIHRSGEAEDAPAMLASFRESGFEDYLPSSLVSFGFNPEQAEWLKNTFGIATFMGWPATQVNVGQLSGEGSPLMPYWADARNPIVPAHSQANNAGLIVLNTSAIDPIGSRYTEGSSRWTLSPGDPYVAENDALPQLHTAGQYLNNPYRARNTMNALTLLLDANGVLQSENLLANWNSFIEGMPERPDLTVIGASGLAGLYAQAAGSGNEGSEFTLEFRGSGYTTQIDGKSSPADLRYLWTETPNERIVLERRDGERAWRVADFTDYARDNVPELPYTNGHGANTDISYVTGRNYKLAPDAPLTPQEKERIARRLSELHFGDPVDYD